eukprot:CCRYP_007567-RA/>CCRYP_007567-RA protein AED:0.29 eAED:0.55 QI:0/-1/0/1/-1/1/1/0/522
MLLLFLKSTKLWATSMHIMLGKTAPLLTVMIGGNHESSNYLQELYYGGWVAPNIYYLGAAGVVNICKYSSDKTSISILRIAGLSGIYKSHDYKLGRFEAPPYSQSDLRSVYHSRQMEVERLRALAFPTASDGEHLKSTNSDLDRDSQPIDIMLSHDWPRGIEQHGNLPQLLQRKPFFKEEIQSNSLGSPANESLLHTLKPRHWFAAHLHVKFEAVVHHHRTEFSNDAATKKKSVTMPEQNESSVFVGLESNEGICSDSTETNIESLTDQMTRFLSLDKCLPKRRHLQILHIEPSSTRAACGGEILNKEAPNRSWLEYDPTWLAIHRRTEEWSQRTQNKVLIPRNYFEQNPLTNDEIQDVVTKLETSASNEGTSNPLAIPLNFVQTVRAHDPHSAHQSYSPPLPMVGNPQTDHFLKMMGMNHKFTVPFCQNTIGSTSEIYAPLATPGPCVDDNNEIDLDLGASDERHESFNNDHSTTEDDGILKNTSPSNPEEINLDDIEDEDGDAGDSICYTPSSATKRPRV